MEGFERENTPLEPEKETTEIYPGREEVLRDATEKAVDAYIARLAEITQEANTPQVFTGKNGATHEPRHSADVNVVQTERRVAIAQSVANETAEADKYYQERMAHVIETIHSQLDIVARGLGELFDNNPEAAKKLAQTLPDVRSI